MELTRAAEDYITEKGYDPVYGARPLKRVIRQLVEIPMSMKILEGNLVKGDKILLDLKDNRLNFIKR